MCDDVLNVALDPSDTVFFLYNPWTLGSPVWNSVLARIERFAIEGRHRVFVLYSANASRAVFDGSNVLRLVESYDTVVPDFDWCLYEAC
jgi:hypothetical protein